jgi:4-amino-4-deoxy-L-arabinose transferase-like glycosyltransferase
VLLKGTEYEMPVAGAADVDPTIRQRVWLEFTAIASRLRTPLTLILVAASAFRLVYINRLGFNADEAVYASQAASVAGVDQFQNIFPVFRAHPLVFQTLLSLIFRISVNDLAARTLAAAFGVATVALTYLIARHMYDRRVGLAAAAILAVMPYDVVVSRQVLLDGPMTCFATATLYCAVRFVMDRSQVQWMFGFSVMMGLTFLTKETSILLLGGLMGYFFISPTLVPIERSVRIRMRTARNLSSSGHRLAILIATIPVALQRRYLRLRTFQFAAAAAIVCLMIAVLPVTISLAGRKSTGQSYLAWQLFRQANHGYGFYPEIVPPAMGLLTVVFALMAVARLLRQSLKGQVWLPTEKLLVCWAIVPIAAFEVYPVKGYQYLLPVAPVVAVLAARQITGLQFGRNPGRIAQASIRIGVLTVVLLSLAVSSWQAINPSPSIHFVAGSGGVPAGREAGQYVRDNLPVGAQIMTIGPSMANIIMYYSQRQSWGLSVSPNPLNRNPSYVPLDNPDRSLRSGDIQYIVWDAFSASRSPHFSAKILQYAYKYHSANIKTFYIRADTERGTTTVPVIRIFEVRP